MALDVKVLTENHEELELKELIENDVDDIPQIRPREVREEVAIDDFDKDEISETLFSDSEDVDIDEDFSTKNIFDDEDDEIDTTIPDGSDLFDDLDDLDGDEDKE